MGVRTGKRRETRQELLEQRDRLLTQMDQWRSACDEMQDTIKAMGRVEDKASLGSRIRELEAEVKLLTQQLHVERADAERARDELGAAHRVIHDVEGKLALAPVHEADNRRLREALRLQSEAVKALAED